MINLRLPRSFRVRIAADWSCCVNILGPGNVESPIGREEVQTGMWQVIVDPPCEQAPVAGRLVSFPELRYDNACGGPHEAIGVPPIPDVSGMVGFVARASVSCLLSALHLVAETVDL